jgi:hypothetical protein
MIEGMLPFTKADRTWPWKASSDCKKGKTRDYKMKMKNTFVKTIGGTALILVLVGATLAWSDPGENHTPTIAGVWQVTRVGVDCSDPNQLRGEPFPAIMTFHRDGIVSGAAKSPVTGPYDTPEHGLWKREPGNQNYSFRELQYRYASNGTFLGPLILTADVELTSANSFIYRSTIQIVDANGNLIASHCGRGTGTRFE